jgi:hydrogenase-4 component F
VCAAAGWAAFAGSWLIVFGLLSLATAAVFIVNNGDYRRHLAYTSVEHMGVLVIGVGLGSAGSYASMLHAMHNTLNKGALFFLAGFVWRLHGTNQIRHVRGMLIRNPAAGVLLLAALCATCGLPPFGMFFSELGMVLAAAQQGRWWVLGLLVLTLSIVFVGVMTAMLPMIFGETSVPAPDDGGRPGERWRTIMMLSTTAVLLLAAMGLGTYQPPAVRDALTRAAAALYHADATGIARAGSAEVHP